MAAAAEDVVDLTAVSDGEGAAAAEPAKRRRRSYSSEELLAVFSRDCEAAQPGAAFATLCAHQDQARTPLRCGYHRLTAPPFSCRCWRARMSALRRRWPRSTSAQQPSWCALQLPLRLALR